MTPHRFGGYTAQCREANLAAEGATRQELVANAQKVAEAYFADQSERGLPAIDFIFCAFGTPITPPAQ